MEGTRTNMLTKVLDAERHPVVELSVAPAAGDVNTVHAANGVNGVNAANGVNGVNGTNRVLRLRLKLNGVERSVDVPTIIEHRTNGLVATGSFTLLQTDFGITPMSVLGGAITVMDQMELRFRLVAGRP